MQNLEIMGIVNAYMAKKEQDAKDRKEGVYVDEMKLPAAVAWKRRVNMDKLFKAKALIDDAMKELSEKYADDEHSVEGENGVRRVKEEYLPEYLKAQGEILAQDTELDIRKVKIEDLGEIELSDSDMDTIGFMIEGE